MSETEEPKQEQEQKQDLFPREYVHDLREENKQARLKAKELEDKLKAIEETEASKRGEFEKLFNQAKEEKTFLEKQLEELTTYKERFTELEKVRREELISQLPEGGHKEFASKILSVEDLKMYVDLNKIVKGKVDDGKTGYQNLNIPDNAKFNQLTIEQKQQLRERDPQRYNKLKTETVNN